MRHRHSEIDETRDAVPGNATGDDSLIMRQVRFDVDRNTVKADPASQADADGRDLVLSRCSVGERREVVPHDPDTNPVRASVPLHVEFGQGGDDPVLELGNEAAHVAAPAPHVEHDVGDPLPGAVIGKLAAASDAMDGKAVGLAQIVVAGARARGVERRVLDQPDRLVGSTFGNRGGPRLHLRQGDGVVGQTFGCQPLNHGHCPLPSCQNGSEMPDFCVTIGPF